MHRPPLELHVVAHTHWDREWYRPAGRFRQRLVALVDEVLDDPPAAGESFLLDGQAIVLDDYLAVRPERAAELSALLRDGRLEAGPWYVLADELIPSGEALVRNLLAGQASLRRLRAVAPPVLYCPDSFGHPAILPELARGFGCTLIVLWRGYGSARWPEGDVVLWRGPSGAEVPVYALPPDGYEFGSGLPVEAAGARQRWAHIERVLDPRSTTRVALLLNGADHHARQHGQRDAVRLLAAAAAPAVVTPGSLRGVAERFARLTHEAKLPTVHGELRDSYGTSWTLQGTLGSRAALKRRNAQVERLLVRDVEPWIALLDLGGDAAIRASLAAAWRTVLESHPHDTLCGTAIDAVAFAMEERLRSASAQARGLREDALLALAGHDRERARAELDDTRPVVMLRNPAPRRRGGVVELRLAATVAGVAVGPGSAARQGKARGVPPWRVQGMPLQILGERERVALTESPRAYPRADRVAEVRALGWVDSIPGYGVEARAQGKGNPPEVPHPIRVHHGIIENGRVRLTVRPDGDVQVEDLASGRSVERVLSFEQREDAGDLYTPAPRETIAAPTLVRVWTSMRGPLRGEVSLRYRFGEGSRGRGGCTVRLQLDAGLPAVRVLLDGENQDGDQRLRVRLSTGLPGATTVADAAFLPVRREALQLPPEQQRDEHVVLSAPLHRWVSRFKEDAGATVFSDGLAEYETLSEGDVLVTLFRAVGQLSRADLPERPGHAGWPAATPGAQSIGRWRARLGFALHGPDGWRTREHIEHLADDLLLPLRGETLRYNLAEPHRAGGLTLEGEGLVFSAAMPAQRAGWIVLRCVNARDVAVAGRWSIGRPIQEAVLARLDETPLGPAEHAGSEVSFRAAPCEIVTLLVR